MKKQGTRYMEKAKIILEPLCFNYRYFNLSLFLSSDHLQKEPIIPEKNNRKSKRTDR